MTQNADQSTTVDTVNDPNRRITAPSPRVNALPTLTIAYHPMLRRIGDRAILSELMAGRPAKISRTAPRFAPPRQEIGSPLDEPHISRKPFLLRRMGDGSIKLSLGETRTRVTADGDVVTDSMTLSPERVKRGVLLELAERVALLLHMHTPNRERETGDLGLVGQSSEIRRVRDDIRQVAGADVPVLIGGETGSGKELVATAIHEASHRRGRPLISVNLAALPASLATAELFGAVRGAFTGAAKNQDGYFRRANGSTLFLDEIGEVPIDVQVMLLRALETGEVYSLGAQRADQVDVRVLAATDADLEQAVRAGDFRAPLLHRLAGYEIHIPPLRHRRDDIVPLLLHFLALELAELGDTDRLHRVEPAPWLPLYLVTSLVRYEWPGNVRQLRNVARQLVIRNRDRTVAEMPPSIARQLQRPVTGDREGEPTNGPSDRTARVPGQGRPLADDTDTKPHYRKPSLISEPELASVLSTYRWDIKATARALKISRTSLYALIRASATIRTAGDLEESEIRACFAATGGDLDAMVDQLRVSKNALRRRIRELGLT